MINRAIQNVLALCSALVLMPSVAAAQGAEERPAAPAPAAVSAEKLGDAMRQQLDTDAKARASQERIAAIDDETLKMLSEYRRALADAESYAAYTRQLESQVQAQTEEMASMDQQLASRDDLREVIP